MGIITIRLAIDWKNSIELSHVILCTRLPQYAIKTANIAWTIPCDASSHSNWINKLSINLNSGLSRMRNARIKPTDNVWIKVMFYCRLVSRNRYIFFGRALRNANQYKSTQKWSDRSQSLEARRRTAWYHFYAAINGICSKYKRTFKTLLSLVVSHSNLISTNSLRAHASRFKAGVTHHAQFPSSDCFLRIPWDLFCMP